LAAKSIRQAVHDSKLDHSIMKRDASSRKGNSGAAKAEASLKLPDWYAKVELSVSAAERPTTKPHFQKKSRTFGACEKFAVSNDRAEPPKR
jgi:hypothetical protein